MGKSNWFAWREDIPFFFVSSIFLFQVFESWRFFWADTAPLTLPLTLLLDQQRYCSQVYNARLILNKTLHSWLNPWLSKDKIFKWSHLLFPKARSWEKKRLSMNWGILVYRSIILEDLPLLSSCRANPILTQIILSPPSRQRVCKLCNYTYNTSRVIFHLWKVFC